MGFFGKKAVDGAAAAAPRVEPRPGGAQPSRKVWGVLLVLSIVMMFVFGGAIAGLVYMRVTTPPLAQVSTAHSKAHKSAKASAETTKEVTKAEAPKPAEETKKPEAKAEPKAEAKAPVAVKAVETKIASDRPTGSPGVHAAALPKHAIEPMGTPAKAEKPAASPAAAKPAATPATGHVRAMVVEFTHPAPSAKEVLLRGPFLVRTGGKKPMLKDSSGVWRLSLSLLPGTYKYSFVVDGKRTPGESRVVQ